MPPDFSSGGTLLEEPAAKPDFSSGGSLLPDFSEQGDWVGSPYKIDLTRINPEPASVIQPSQFSSGVPPGTPPSLNPDWDFTTSAVHLTKSAISHPLGSLLALPQIASVPFALVGKPLAAALEDAGAVAGGNPEGFGNLAALNQEPITDTKTPFAATMADVSQTHPYMAAGAKTAAGLAESAPMMAAGLPEGALGNIIGTYFTAQSILSAKDAANRLHAELEKPANQRNQDAFSSALADLALNAPFAPSMGAHALGAPIGENFFPNREAADRLAAQLKSYPLGPANPDFSRLRLLDQPAQVLTPEENGNSQVVLTDFQKPNQFTIPTATEVLGKNQPGNVSTESPPAPLTPSDLLGAVADLKNALSNPFKSPAPTATANLATVNDPAEEQTPGANPVPTAPSPEFAAVNQAGRPDAEPVSAKNLSTGDTFKLNGQIVKVIGAATDGPSATSGPVELDGAYGRQTVPADTTIHLDAGTWQSPKLTPPAPAPGQPSKMVVADLTHPRGGMTKEAIAAAVADLRQSLNNSTDLYIAQNLDALPEHLQAEPRQLLQDRKLVMGFYEDGVAYMVADHIPDAATAKTVFLEEALGHAGMEPMLTPQDVDQLYGLIWQGDEANAKEIASLYGQDLNTPKGRTDFVGEYVAKASTWWLEKPRLWRRVTDVLLRAAYRVPALHNIAPRLILHAQMRGLTRWAAARLSDGSIPNPDHTLSTSVAPADPHARASQRHNVFANEKTSPAGQSEEVSPGKRNITSRFNQVPAPRPTPRPGETSENNPTSASEPNLPETANTPSQPAAGTMVPPAPVASKLPHPADELEENTPENAEIKKPAGTSVTDSLDKSSNPSTANSGLGPGPAPETSSVKPLVFGRIKQAFNWALQNIRGTVRNQATGFDIAIARSGIAKTLSGKAVEKSNSLDAHLAALRQLPELLQRASLTEARPSTKQTESISTIYRFTAPMDFAGQKHLVKMTVREHTQPAGKNFYTLETAEIEKPAGISVTDSLDKSSNPSTASSGLALKLTPETPSVKSLPTALENNPSPPAAGTLDLGKGEPGGSSLEAQPDDIKPASGNAGWPADAAFASDSGQGQRIPHDKKGNPDNGNTVIGQSPPHPPNRQRQSRQFSLGDQNKNAGGISHETAQAGIDQYHRLVKDAPEVLIENQPDWTHEGHGVRGTVRDGKIIINRSHIEDESTLQKVLREEHNHLLLASEAGRAAIHDAVTINLGGGELARLSAQYHRLIGESVTDWHRRLTDEFIAKAASEKLPVWKHIVERVKTWLAAKGIGHLNHEETARAIIRALKAGAEPKAIARLLDVSKNNAGIATAAAREFQSWPERVKAADGSGILLRNPEGGSLGQRVKHLIFDNTLNRLLPNKAKWLPNVPETLKNAELRLVDPESGNRVYVRTYENGRQHLVIVRPDGVVTDQMPFTGKLITQFPFENGRQLGFKIEWRKGHGQFQGTPKPTPKGSSHLDARQSAFQNHSTPDNGTVNPPRYDFKPGPAAQPDVAARFNLGKPVDANVTFRDQREKLAVVPGAPKIAAAKKISNLEIVQNAVASLRHWFGKTVRAADGNEVLFKNPKWNTLEKFTRHLISDNDSGSINRFKAAMVPLMEFTLQNAQLRLYDPHFKTRAYLCRVSPDDWHMVFVDSENQVKYQGDWNGAKTFVETQFSPKPAQGDNFLVEWVGKNSGVPDSLARLRQPQRSSATIPPAEGQLNRSQSTPETGGVNLHRYNLTEHPVNPPEDERTSSLNRPGRIEHDEAKSGADPADLPEPVASSTTSEPNLPETANTPSQPAAGTMVPPAPVASKLPHPADELEENTPENAEIKKPAGTSVTDSLDKSSNPSTASSGLTLKPTSETPPVKPPILSKIKQAFNWALQNIRGTVRNQATGFDITIARSGIAKTLSGKAVEKSNSLDVHLAALRQLPELLQQANLAESRPALKKVENISTIYRFTAPMDFAGQKYLVKMTVREHTRPAGKNFYTLETAEIEKPAGNISMVDSLDKSSNPSVADSGLESKRTPEPPAVKSLPAAAELIRPPNATLTPANENENNFPDEASAQPPNSGRSAAGELGSTALARTAGHHGSLAADATAYLRRTRPLRESDRPGTGEIDRQAAQLSQWAQENGNLLPRQSPGQKLAQGAEHEVFIDPSGSRIIKRTYPGTFGIKPDAQGVQLAATPEAYLNRLELMNRVFGSDVRMEGIQMGESPLLGRRGDEPAIVTSQPYIKPESEDNPYPSAAEIDHFMRQAGFQPKPNSYYGWERPADGVSALDARPDNFIKTAKGVVPVDLVMEQKPSAAQKLLSKLDSLKLDTNGQFHAFGLVPLVWNTLVNGVKLSLRSGLSAKDAIDANLARLQAAGHQFDIEGARAWLTKNLTAAQDLADASSPGYQSSVPAVKAPGFAPGPINFIRRAARNFIKTLRGQSFINEDTQVSFLIDRTSERKAVSHLRRLEELHALSALPEMLQRAKYDSSAPDNGSHADVLNWHYYQIPVEVAGKVHEAIIVVREMADSRRFYDSYFLRLDEPAGGIPPRPGPLLDRSAAGSASTGPQPDPTAKSEKVNPATDAPAYETDSAISPAHKLLNIQGNHNLAKARTAEEFFSWPDRQTAADGSELLLKNPRGGSLEERLEHLTSDNFTGQLSPTKAQWLPNVRETLQNADQRLVNQQTGNRLYVRTYADGTQHAVIVQPDGPVQTGKPFTGKLITQFPVNEPGSLARFKTEWEKRSDPEKEPADVSDLPEGDRHPDGPSASHQKTTFENDDANSAPTHSTGLTVDEATRHINAFLGTPQLPAGIRVIRDETATWAASIINRNQITLNAAQVVTAQDVREVIYEEGLHGVWNHPAVQRAWQAIRDLVTPEEMYAERHLRLAQGLPADPATIREEATIARLIRAEASHGVFARFYDTIRTVFKQRFGIDLPATSHRQQLKDAAIEFLRNRNDARGAKNGTIQTEQSTHFAIGTIFKEQREQMPVVPDAPKIEAGKKILNHEIVQRAANYIRALFGKNIIAADGNSILVKNPKWNTLEEFTRHLISDNDSKSINRFKAATVPLMEFTLKNAQLRLYDDRYGTRVYACRVSPTEWHMVFVDSDNRVNYQGNWSGTKKHIETQFSPAPQHGDYFKIEWEWK